MPAGEPPRTMRVMIDLPPPVPYQPSPPASPPPLPEPPRFRPTALLAWLVILGVCVALPLLRSEKQTAAPTTAPTTLPVAGTLPEEESDRVTVQVEMAGRMWVGLVRIISQLGGGDDARQQFEKAVELPQDTPTEKLAAAVILKEFRQDDRADKLLAAVNDRDAEAIKTHYDGEPPATLPSSIHDRLGWFARLADTHGRPDADPQRAAVLSEATRSAVAIIGAAVLIVGALIVGIGLFITAVVLLSLGKITIAPGRPVGPAHVYVEAVAIYLGGFIVASVLVKWLVPDAGIAASVVGLGCVVVMAAVWPLLRGVPIGVMRRDWGIHAGRGVLREMAAGVGGYVAGLPVVAVGFVITLVLIKVTDARPTHPIMQGGGNGSVLTALTLYGIAAIFAPLTEELLFRGAFVSHLRAGVNAVLAALISGFVFAAVHPQGWTVVPVLMSVGAVLALVRQWRGSLIASTTAHAMHNGVLVTVMLLATS